MALLAKPLPADRHGNPRLYGECVLCHIRWRLDFQLRLVNHGLRGNSCQGSRRPPRPGTVSDSEDA